jgi:hypothetical protein
MPGVKRNAEEMSRKMSHYFYLQDINCPGESAMRLPRMCESGATFRLGDGTAGGPI